MPQSLVQWLGCIVHSNQRGNTKLTLRERELTFTEFCHELGTLQDLMLDLIYYLSDSYYPTP